MDILILALKFWAKTLVWVCNFHTHHPVQSPHFSSEDVMIRKRQVISSDSHKELELEIQMF